MFFITIDPSSCPNHHLLVVFIGAINVRCPQPKSESCGDANKDDQNSSVSHWQQKLNHWAEWQASEHQRYQIVVQVECSWYPEEREVRYAITDNVSQCYYPLFVTKRFKRRTIQIQLIETRINQNSVVYNDDRKIIQKEIFHFTITLFPLVEEKHKSQEKRSKNSIKNNSKQWEKNKKIDNCIAVASDLSAAHSPEVRRDAAENRPVFWEALRVVEADNSHISGVHSKSQNKRPHEKWRLFQTNPINGRVDALVVTFIIIRLLRNLAFFRFCHIWGSARRALVLDELRFHVGPEEACPFACKRKENEVHVKRDDVNRKGNDCKCDAESSNWKNIPKKAAACSFLTDELSVVILLVKGTRDIDNRRLNARLYLERRVAEMDRVLCRSFLLVVNDSL